MTKQEEIALRLKTLRKHLKLSQKQLAGELEISQPYYGNMEASNRELSSEIIRKLHELYHVSADWLLFGEGEMFKKKGDEGEGDPVLV